MRKARSRIYKISVVTAYMMAILFGGYSCNQKTENITLPSTLRVGVLPDQGRQELEKRYLPLLEHLSKETRISFKLIIPGTYDELAEMFEENKIDLARFGGFTFVQANIRHGAVPLVMRDIDSKFTSYFIVGGDSSAKDIKDFKGKRIALN